jgi:type IV pilus assembly protein PilO
MKRLYRRQRQQYLLAIVLGVIAIVNVLFFLILYRPVRGEYDRLQSSIERLRAEVQTQQQQVARLERLSAQLEGSEKDRQRLFTAHFIPRQAGFSEILPELDDMAAKAGVRKTRVDYAIDDAPHYGLYSVKIRVPVTGEYSNIVKFIKNLEHSDTFFIIDSIAVRGAATGSQSTDVALSLDLETFFYK